MTPCAECRAQQAKEPKVYVFWHMWAEARAKKHKQVKCPVCGCLRWVKKEEGEKNG